MNALFSRPWRRSRYLIIRELSGCLEVVSGVNFRTSGAAGFFVGGKELTRAVILYGGARACPSLRLFLPSRLLVKGSK